MINQIIYSVRTRPQFEEAAHEALRRAKFKIPGRQYIVSSANHGFSKLTREKYAEMREAGHLVKDGVMSSRATERAPSSRLLCRSSRCFGRHWPASSSACIVISLIPGVLKCASYAVGLE